jgi:hypothetical protein
MKRSASPFIIILVFVCASIWMACLLSAATQPVQPPTPKPPQMTTPNDPSDFAAFAVSPTQVNLTWKDNSNNETGFEIWMKMGSGGQWSLQTTTPPNTTNWGYSGLTTSGLYFFRVWAVNAAGRSQHFVEASAVPMPASSQPKGPTITVILPKGSPSVDEQEKWEPGSTHTIQWRYTGDIGPAVQINLYKWYPKGIRNSRATGGFGARVNVTPGGSGSYTWVVPPKKEVIEPEYQISIASTTKPNVIGESGFFTITGPLMTEEQLLAPALSLVSPLEGETWTTGSTQTIRWTYKENPPGPDVKIVFLASPTSLFDFITRKTPVGNAGSGSFTWTIPADWPANTFILRVMSTANESYRGERHVNLVHPAPKINVTSPARGEKWMPGSTQTIRWTYTGDIGPALNVGLFLKGSAVASVAMEVRTAPGGNGSCQWVVPKNLPSLGDYTIRVISPLRKLTGESAAFIIP